MFEIEIAHRTSTAHVVYTKELLEV